MAGSLREVRRYIVAFGKWLALGVALGLAAGLVGAAFHVCVDFVTELRGARAWIVFLLPVGGAAIALLYRLGKTVGANEVIEAERDGGALPLLTVPLIFISTVITQLVGGSAGKEGAAIQMGGTLGCRLGNLARMDEKDLPLAVSAGVAAMFAAVFGTPVTAVVFAVEVVSAGAMRYAALLPCATSALTAVWLVDALSVEQMRFAPMTFPALAPAPAGMALCVAAACALASIAFVKALHAGERLAARAVKDTVWRAALGGALVAGLTALVGKQDYNGAGIPLLYRAVNEGDAETFAFALKLLFTVITVSAGFRGGEIVPSLCVGATLGCLLATLTGFDARFCAALGMLCMFCAMVNCPLAAVFMGVELFGAEGAAYYALACAACYLLSGMFGLYHGQRFAFSKRTAERLDMCARG